MISMKKNAELFWILEVLLLTPLALFWLGIVSRALNGSDDLLSAVLGEPRQVLRFLLIAVLAPALAVLLASSHLRESKRKKSATTDIARAIVWVGGASVIIVTIFFLGNLS